MGTFKNGTKNYTITQSELESIVEDNGLLIEIFEMSNRKAKNLGLEPIRIPKGELLKKLVKAYSWQARMGYSRKKIKGFNLADTQNYLRTEMVNNFLEENLDLQSSLSDIKEVLAESIYHEDVMLDTTQPDRLKLIQPPHAEIGKTLYFMSLGYHCKKETDTGCKTNGKKIRQENPVEIVPAFYRPTMFVGNNRLLIARFQNIQKIPAKKYDSNITRFSSFIKRKFSDQQEYFAGKTFVYFHNTLQFHVNKMIHATWNVDDIPYKNILNETWVPGSLGSSDYSKKNQK